MTLTCYGILTVILIGAEWLYIQFARSQGWFDAPNERSAHNTQTTVRSGGIVLYLAGIVGIGSDSCPLLFVGLGLTVIAAISFWDDLASVPKRYRLAVHGLAVGGILLQEGLIFETWFLVAGLLLLGVGIVNAYNFMDGINGMTAFYSLVTVGTLWYEQAQTPAGGIPLFPSIFIALLIFSYANARQQAICFAGDVGSISMGFMILYGLLDYIQRMNSCLPILFLSVYGVDSIGTLIYRLYLRQNIFQAHRLHLFQLLVHKRGWPHLRVAALYAFVQAGINLLVIMAIHWSSMNPCVLAGGILSGLLIAYVWARKQLVLRNWPHYKEPDLYQAIK